MSLSLQKVLILQQSKDTPVGTTEMWLQKHNFPVAVLKVWEIGGDLNRWPKLESFDWLVLCGGSPNVDEEHLWPWMKAEKLFIAQAIAQKKKILGLCLGAQLLAEALGAKVHRHEHSEVGWFDVQIKNDHPLFQFSKNTLKVFQYHSYRFHLPKSAERISWNEVTSDQAFVLERMCAFQFHPESTSQWVVECATDLKNPLPLGKHCQDAATILQLNKQHQEQLQHWYFEFLKHFSAI